jgi:hypothetical protein
MSRIVGHARPEDQVLSAMTRQLSRRWQPSRGDFPRVFLAIWCHPPFRPRPTRVAGTFGFRRQKNGIRPGSEAGGEAGSARLPPSWIWFVARLGRSFALPICGFETWECEAPAELKLARRAAQQELRPPDPLLSAGAKKKWAEPVDRPTLPRTGVRKPSCRPRRKAPPWH